MNKLKSAFEQYDKKGGPTGEDYDGGNVV
jgi:hypothetical protein